MVALRYTVFSDTLSPGLVAVEGRLRDLSPAMAAIAAYGLSETQQNFEDQRSPEGVPWRPSADAIKEGRLTLVKTPAGGLLDSLSSTSDTNSAAWGTNKIYAAIHNQGGTIRAKGRSAGGSRGLKTPFGYRASVSMPRRQFIGHGPDDPAAYKSILVEHLTGGAA